MRGKMCWTQKLTRIGKLLESPRRWLCCGVIFGSLTGVIGGYLGSHLMVCRIDYLHFVLFIIMEFWYFSKFVLLTSTPYLDECEQWACAQAHPIHTTRITSSHTVHCLIIRKKKHRNETEYKWNVNSRNYVRFFRMWMDNSSVYSSKALDVFVSWCCVYASFFWIFVNFCSFVMRASRLRSIALLILRRRSTGQKRPSEYKWKFRQIHCYE